MVAVVVVVVVIVVVVVTYPTFGILLDAVVPQYAKLPQCLRRTLPSQ